MTTTREMLDEAGLGCGAPGASVQIGIDAYEDLRNATPQELLEAAIWFYKRVAIVPDIPFLKLGFALAGRDGWQYVAPVWLRESRILAEAGE